MNRATMAAVFVAAFIAAPAFSQQSAPSATKVPKEVQAFIAKFTTTMNGKSAEAMAALYAKDGEVVGDDGVVHSGEAAIIDLYNTIFKQFGDFSIAITPIEAHGQWAIEKSVITLNRPNGQIHIASHLVTVIEGHGDNMHMRLLSIGPDSRPPAPPAASK